MTFSSWSQHIYQWKVRNLNIFAIYNICMMNKNHHTITYKEKFNQLFYMNIPNTGALNGEIFIHVLVIPLTRNGGYI